MQCYFFGVWDWDTSLILTNLLATKQLKGMKQVCVIIYYVILLCVQGSLELGMMIERSDVRLLAGNFGFSKLNLKP